MVDTYFSFTGRMSLSSFWIKFNLFNVAAGLFLRFFTFSYPDQGWNLRVLFSFVTLWPYAATMTKRMHDRGRPMWYWLSFVIFGTALQLLSPMFGPWKNIFSIAALIAFAVIGIEAQLIPGNDDDNRFGPNPQAGQRWDGSSRLPAENNLRRAQAPPKS